MRPNLQGESVFESIDRQLRGLGAHGIAAAVDAVAEVLREMDIETGVAAC